MLCVSSCSHTDAIVAQDHAVQLLMSTQLGAAVEAWCIPTKAIVRELDTTVPYSHLPLFPIFWSPACRRGWGGERSGRGGGMKCLPTPCWVKSAGEGHGGWRYRDWLQKLPIYPVSFPKIRVQFYVFHHHNEKTRYTNDRRNYINFEIRILGLKQVCTKTS